MMAALLAATPQWPRPALRVLMFDRSCGTIAATTKGQTLEDRSHGSGDGRYARKGIAGRRRGVRESGYGQGACPRVGPARHRRPPPGRNAAHLAALREARRADRPAPGRGI